MPPIVPLVGHTQTSLGVYMRFSLLFMLLLSISLFCFGQATGRLEGTVTDPSGAVIPAASVKVVNPGTGQNFDLITDERGFFVIPSLPPATYKLTVNQPGFKTFSLNDVKIDASVPARVSVVL